MAQLQPRRDARARSMAASVGMLIAIGMLAACDRADQSADATPAARTAAADKSQSATDLSGTWAPDVQFLPVGIPVVLNNTDWAPLSAGRPEDRKAKTIEEQAAYFQKLLDANVDLFAVAAREAFHPPYTDAGQAAQKQLMAASAKGSRTPIDMCMPRNIVGSFGSGGLELAQTKDRVLMAFEDGSFRTLFADGRGHEQSLPSWTGHSTARWDGNAMSVESVNFRGDSAQMGFAMWPMSNQARLIETFSLSPDGTTLTVKQVYEDPQYIKEPVARMIFLKRQAPDYELVLAPCLESIQGAAEFQDLVGKHY
jgi:hypothetical protein